MKRNRALLTVLPAALVASLLAGCSSDGDSNTNSDVTCAAEGAVSKSIKVDGDLGATDIELSSDLPVEAEALERSVLIEGKGAEVAAGDELKTQLTLFNGATGEQISTEAASLQVSEEVLIPWAYNLVSCATIGDRVVGVAPAAELIGEGQEEALGLESGGSLVVVIDVTGKTPDYLEESELLEKAEGKAEQVPSGVPTVELAEDGSPTITMPTDAPPTKLTIVPLITGEGEKVEDGDRVYVHYRGVIWRTGEEFDSSWSRGSSTNFLTTGVIRGFEEALVGQTVGSQVMAIVPAEDGGYGAAWLESRGYEPDDVMVFVLDILGTVHEAG